MVRSSVSHAPFGRSDSKKQTDDYTHDTDLIASEAVKDYSSLVQTVDVANFER